MSRPGALLLLLLAACGYSAGFDLANEGIRTVAVEVAGNASFRQKLEVPLMRELHQALAEHSQLVVAKPAAPTVAWSSTSSTSRAGASRPAARVRSRKAPSSSRSACACCGSPTATSCVIAGCSTGLNSGCR